MVLATTPLMELDLDRIGSERFDLIGQFDLVFVDLDGERCRNRRGDVGVRHRAEELAVAAGFRPRRQAWPIEALGERFGLGQLPCASRRALAFCCASSCASAPLSASPASLRGSKKLRA